MFAQEHSVMRIVIFVTIGLIAGCKQAGPTIIDKPEAVETLDPNTVSSQPSLPPQEMQEPPVGPPPPVLDDGTPLHPPVLPPGMKPDPNSNDLQSIARRNCEICHGTHGQGVGTNVPNYQEEPQLINNAMDPMIKRILAGHGGAPALDGKLKSRTIYHLIEYMRGRVGQARAMINVQAVENAPAAPTPAIP